MTDDPTRGAHPSDPAEGSPEQGEDAESRVREQSENSGDDREDSDTESPEHG